MKPGESNDCGSDTARRWSTPELRQHGADFLDQVAWSDELDPHYTRLWLEFTYGGVYVRGVLDERTRQLVVVGQFVAMNELDELPVHIRAALAAGAQPREVLEVILQSTVYFGYSRARRASVVFRRTMDALGLLESVLASAPPRGTWPPPRTRIRARTLARPLSRARRPARNGSAGNASARA
jgi:4-carboxymuconolactone decarboxylase